MKKITSFLFATTMLALVACGNKGNQNANSQATTEQAPSAADTTAQTSDAPQYIDLQMPSLNGKNIKISDYVSKNKITMVDFWASWCGPCRAEMPNVVQAYKDFHDKGLEIIGVSFDQSKKDWAEAVKALGMTWPQMSDLKGWESAAVAAYHIEGIPYSILINQKGEIVAQDLRGEELHRKLAELLK